MKERKRQIGVCLVKKEFANINRYLAFLRGINVSGKNTIQMTELKKCFEKLEFEEVRTYLNSGNVAFSSDKNDPDQFKKQIEAVIKKQFALNIPVCVILREELDDILHHAPDWWGNENKEIYDNLIFVIPPATSADVYRKIGAPKDGLEKIKEYKNAIFWSFSRKEYQKTNWWAKTANTNIKDKITIRTAGTVRKAVYL